MAQLCRRRDAFEEAGLNVVLVSMGTREEAGMFRSQFAVPYPIICDPDKVLYREYGLKGSTMLQFLSPRLVVRGLKTVGQGYLPGLPRGDPFQLAGSFVIGTDGAIRFSHYSRDPSDYLPAGALLTQATRF